MKPIELPKHIFAIATAIPPNPTACAASTFPALIALKSAEYFFMASAQSGTSAESRPTSTRTTREPAFLNSGERAQRTSHGAIAKLTRVGGTSMSLNDPDIESFPPIAAAPSPICASYAPSSAASGLPQRFGSERSFSKYS